ncbi:toxin CcdB [Rahnella sp. BIGb0236]|jgi:toxin CcdB|uniref:CcdB family protein n=1 Tax=Rahnella sp. BIGb0236 TaxID=2485117 RepID=UPI0010623280|nr:CcdB family protein [Rahnella sp. BIGb0236]TDS90286.1 toxin CcdB [Rahnella sp. BIGb0236]VTQ53229.1 plasmid maintenance protein CcdB [Campylobacter jejuni]
MAQFDVYENQGEGKNLYPYFMDIQNPLIERLNERIVVPLTALSNLKPIRHLHPLIRIQNHQYVLMTNLLTSVSATQLRHEPVLNADIHRADVVAALDLLVMGI